MLEQLEEYLTLLDAEPYVNDLIDAKIAAYRADAEAKAAAEYGRLDAALAAAKGFLAEHFQD